MILYNVTCLVNANREQEWLAWMKETHIPEVLDTGLFLDHRMYKIDSNEGDSGSSYSIQYTLESRANFFLYRDAFGPELKNKTLAKFGEDVHAFRTLMELVS